VTVGIGGKATILALLISAAPNFVVLPAVAAMEIPLQDGGQPIPRQNSTLSPGAIEAAALLGVRTQIDRLMAIAQTSGTGSILSDEELSIRVEVLDKVMGGSLEVRLVADRIDRELAWANNAKGTLEGKRQKRLNYLFTSNFLQGGILGVAAGHEFLTNHPRTGTKLLLIASSVGLGLSSLALLQQRSGTKRIDGGTTALAEVFQLNLPEDRNHNPTIVLKFLDSVPPLSTNNKTRRQLLIESWKKGRYLQSSEEKYLQRLAAYQPEGGKSREDIGLLGTRIRMLFDTQWTVEQLDAELLDLLRATQR